MSSVFSKLDADIITFHILPHLDGKTLIILSSVSSQFNNLICKNNNSDLWRNICTSTWPSLLINTIPDFLSSVISNLPGGYRYFFSDVFPPIHPPLNINPSLSLSPPSPMLYFFYSVDIFLHGEPQPFCSFHTTRRQTFRHGSEERRRYPEYPPDHPLILEFNIILKYSGFEFRLCRPIPKDFIKLKKQGFEEYLKQNLTFSCVVIESDEIDEPDEPDERISAGSLFTRGCKPVSVKPARGLHMMFKVVFETLLPSLSNFYTQMVKCRTKLLCDWQDDGEEKFRVRCVYTKFKDMNGKPVWDSQAIIIILNAIQNRQIMRKNKQN